MDDNRQLSRELTRLVSATGGVIGVFRAGSAIASTARGLIDHATGTNEDDARVTVERTGDRLRIATTIGVDTGLPVTDTVRAVRDAIAAYLSTIGVGTPPDIEVKVSYIERPTGHTD